MERFGRSLGRPSMLGLAVLFILGMAALTAALGTTCVLRPAASKQASVRPEDPQACLKLYSGNKSRADCMRQASQNMPQGHGTPGVLPSPLPVDINPSISPEVWPTGIIEANPEPQLKGIFAGTSVWQGVVGSERLQVRPGCFDDNSGALPGGVVVIAYTTSDPAAMLELHSYHVLAGIDCLRPVEIHRMRLKMLSRSGAKVTFDIAARSFV